MKKILFTLLLVIAFGRKVQGQSTPTTQPSPSMVPQYFSYSATQTLVTAGYHNFVEMNCSSACTLTLPATTTLAAQTISVINVGTATVTVSSTAIGNASTSTTATVATGSISQYISNGTSAWRTR